LLAALVVERRIASWLCDFL